ncbi:MAG: type III-B CRISPR module-associated protein Cmr5 [Limnochordia bacterium]|nr:type III-B CRISPR module-associated protein Cmr5 [Limnochordia bacterium]
MVRAMYGSLDQQRAQDVATKIAALTDEVAKKVDNRQQDWIRRYSNRVECLPATILMNGLGQSMATLLAAANKDQHSADYQLYAHIEAWLCRDHKLAPFQVREGGSCDLMDAIINSDRHTYLWAQEETLAWLVWMKKFTRAYFKIVKEGAENNADTPVSR